MKGFMVYNPETGQDIKLTLQDLYLSGKIIDIGSKLVIRHIFQHSEKTPVEAVYSFMLPRDAAIKSFKVVGENFTAVSKLVETEEAREEYEEGIEAGKLSFLSQQYRDGVVNLSIGNIRPNERVIVYLELYTGVEILDDGFRFRFPFTMAPGYHPKARPSNDDKTGEILLPEEEFGDVLLPEWRADADNLHSISFKLDVESQAQITSIGSPSHPVIVELDDKHGNVMLGVGMDTPDRDLVLEVKTEPIPRIITVKAPDGEARFAAIIPSNRFGESRDEQRRIVFLVDRSGSMQGRQMSEAKRAILACLGALSEQDKFSIVAFDSRIESFSNRLVSGSQRNREKATIFVDRISARGGTELVNGLKEAYSLLGGNGGDVLLFTDGQVMDSEDILANVVKDDIRVHCLGIGSASQDRFLSLLARQSGGLSRFMSPRERVDLSGLKLFSSIKSPVAQDITVNLKDLKAQLEPSPSIIVYQGSPLVIWGTVKDAKKGSINVSWSNGEVNTPLVFTEDFDYDIVKQIHGSRLLTDLDAQYTENKSKRQQRIRRRIEKLSLEYGLSSKFYSLVSVISREDDAVGSIPKTIVVPVGMPRDTEFTAYFALQNAPSSSWKKMNIPVNDKLHRIGVPMLRKNDASISYEMDANLRIYDAVIDAEKTGFDAFDLAARIAPDGGMLGDTTETRVLYTVLTLLYLYTQPSEIRNAFQQHIQRLQEYLQKLPDDLPQTQKTIIKNIIDKFDHGITIDGDWYPLLEQFYREEEIESNKIWRKLKDASK